MLNNFKLTRLIKTGEGERVEFTSSVRDLDKIREAICAFANDLPNRKKPGLLFIGLNDDGSHCGLQVDDKLLLQLSGLKGDGKIQPLPTMAVEKRQLQGGDVAVIQVEVSDNPPVRVNGRCWIRVGPRRGQATSEDERRLTEKRQWGNVPFDMQGVRGASVENDLDMGKFELEYLPHAVSPEALEENDRDRTKQMQALRLLTQDGIPTVTAILLLGKNPRNWFPGAYVQFVRFESNESTDPILDHQELHGTLFDQLNTLKTLIKINISIAMETDGMKHKNIPDYPAVALRELAYNAVIHKNYDGGHAPVRVYWFSDGVQIVNSGSVYGDVTREDLNTGGKTAYRNPTIAEAMKNMGFMERFGVGIATARRALADNGNPPPQFTVDETTVTVQINKRS